MNFLVTHILKISKENNKPMAPASDTLTFSPSDQGHLSRDSTSTAASGTREGEEDNDKYGPFQKCCS